MNKPGTLYEEDFVRWTEEQAAVLRRAKTANLPLDWDNLAEEIESLGISQRLALASQIRRILRHLLKLEASPALEPRAGWQTSILDARAQIESLLRTSPSLRREVEGMIRDQLGTAARLAAKDLTAHGEPSERIRAREAGGFAADEVLGDWFPGQAS